MSEKIGQVVLDDTYYPGRDLYTDGAIEDEMLEIAMTYPEEKWNQVIAERKSWPILYHFSHIRENILSWLPFTGEENVLEIGSGCGAVTGALCKKAKSVTCIELSRKRSLINANRHKEFDNLRILMGNFQDIEKNLTEKYDYITLIGVFEYGEAYINSSSPYVDFLRIISRHLKPDGKIVLAIENRFGLKYWAGCTEDHFGTLFEGLEGYPTTKGVKTFTKKEFSEILKAAGDLKAAWYYPFPDYKLPMTIYSDERLPFRGELNRLETNYDRLRLQLFQESPVYDSLLDNDLFPEFSNSFLLLIGKEKPEISTVYSKFSNERAPEFALRTDICKGDKKEQFVKKVPTETAAEKHVRNLESLSREMAKIYAQEGLELNQCTLDKQGVRLEFLRGKTLEEQLDAFVEQGRDDEAEKLLFRYIDKIRRIHSRDAFYKTPEFIRVFGNVSVEKTLFSSGISNIDLVPANILIDGDRVSVIDYEWTFRFPVPCNFIIYRMIHYYLESDGKRRALKDRDFYSKAGLTAKELEAYAEMEHNFQNYIKGRHVPLLDMYEDVSPGKVDVLSYYEQLRIAGAERKLQVFYDRGEDFSEKDSAVYPMAKTGLSLKIQIPDGVRRLRLDPGEAAGGLALRRLTVDEKQAVFHTNGFDMGEDKYYFGAGDPQFILDDIQGKNLDIEIEVLKEQEAREEFWQRFSQISSQREQEIQQLNQKIQQMENTKVWKLYRSIKKN
ncbi:MAG: methyltransferase [Eubacteriales bacterium]|nr:methyltransferase [Eubacteriales bacterium]